MADGYEAGRATLLAKEGYVGFAADIYGSDLQQVEDFQERIALVTEYRTNYTLFVSRIQAAVDLVAAHELVDPEKVVLIGYCFGGTGVVDYAFADVKNAKVNGDQFSICLQLVICTANSSVTSRPLFLSMVV